MLSPLSREASVEMLSTKATHCEKSLEDARRRRMTRLFAPRCATYPPVDADLEFAVVMHSTLFQSSLLNPHADCHHLSELLSNQKRLPLAEGADYAERN